MENLATKNGLRARGQKIGHAARDQSSTATATTGSTIQRAMRVELFRLFTEPDTGAGVRMKRAGTAQ